MHAADHWVGDGDRQSRLTRSGLNRLLPRFARFDDVDALGGDVNAAVDGDDVAADLAVITTRLDDDVAADAAERAGSGACRFERLLGALLPAAERETDATAAEESALSDFVEVGFAVDLACRLNDDVVRRAQCDVAAGDDVAADNA